MESLEIFAQRVEAPPPTERPRKADLQYREPSRFERQLNKPKMAHQDAPKAGVSKQRSAIQNTSGNEDIASEVSSEAPWQKELRADEDTVSYVDQSYLTELPFHLTTSSSEILATIGALYQSPDNLKIDAPVLSLLTGQLEGIQPEQIPNLVINNNFIQEAMSHSNIEHYFSAPTNITQFIKNIGLEDIAEKMNSMFIENPLISPAAALEALGFDSQNILNELKLLQGYLNTGGLNPYMIRAAALNGQENQKIASANEAKSPLVTRPPIKTVSPRETAQISMPLGPWETPDYDNPEIAHAMTGVSSTEARKIADQFSRDIKLSSNKFNSPGDTDQVGTNLVAEEITQDPFLDVQRSWTDTESISFDSPTGSTKQDFHQVLERISMARSPRDIGLNTVSQEAHNIEPNLDVEVDSETTTIDDTNQILAKISTDDISSQLFGDQSNQSNDQDSEFHSQEDQTPFPTSSPRTQETSPFELEISQEIKVESKQNIKDVVFERAQMMLKDGGGSIRLNLNTLDMGRVDLALDVNHDTLKLRIIADSDKTRELLAQELPALRQALLDQSLDLKTVEIGLRSEEQWASNNPDGKRDHQQERFFEQQEDRPEQGQDQNWNYIKKAITRQATSRTHAPHSGNIQIRV